MPEGQTPTPDPAPAARQDPEPGALATRQDHHDPKVMPFGAHLEELRRRLLFALISIAPIFLTAAFFGGTLLEFLLHPAREQLRNSGLPPMLIVTNPLEILTAWLKVAAVCTLLLGIPLILYQLWLFIAPGLYDHEKRFAKLLLPLSALLSITGLLFLYYVLLPATLAFLIGFGSDVGAPRPTTAPTPPGLVLPSLPILDADPIDPPPGHLWFNRSLDEIRLNIAQPPPEGQPIPPPDIRGVHIHKPKGISQQYKVSEYVSLVFTMSLALAVGFQTPVAVLLLGWLGIVTAPTLARARRYALFACFILAALLTPSPDPFNMLILAIPLYALFELGLLLLRLLPPSRVARGFRLADLRKPPPREADGDVDDL